MTDIVKWLRMAERYGNVSAKKAADEIERLWAALEAIEADASTMSGVEGSVIDRIKRTAAAALKSQEP